MRKWFRRILWTVIVFLVLAQFVPVSRTNPPVDSSKTLAATVPVPPEVAVILQRSCQDCHSNLTRWPWYSHIAPVSWGVWRDVTGARNHLNLSEWGAYSERRKDTRLGDIVEQVTSGEMPDSKYLWIHRDAKLSAQDKKTLIDWAEATRKNLSYKKVPAATDPR
jgi:hypothetical protein